MVLPYDRKYSILCSLLPIANIYSILIDYIFLINSDSSNFLAEQLFPLSQDERDEWLDRITTHIQSQGLTTPNIEVAHIELAINVSYIHIYNNELKRKKYPENINPYRIAAEPVPTKAKQYLVL